MYLSDAATRRSAGAQPFEAMSLICQRLTFPFGVFIYAATRDSRASEFYLCPASSMVKLTYTESDVCLVAAAVFKTVVDASNAPGWVRFPPSPLSHIQLTIRRLQERIVWKGVWTQSR